MANLQQRDLEEFSNTIRKILVQKCSLGVQNHSVVKVEGVLVFVLDNQEVLQVQIDDEVPCLGQDSRIQVIEGHEDLIEDEVHLPSPAAYKYQCSQCQGMFDSLQLVHCHQCPSVPFIEHVEQYSAPDQSGPTENSACKQEELDHCVAELKQESYLSDVKIEEDLSERVLLGRSLARSNQPVDVGVVSVAEDDEARQWHVSTTGSFQTRYQPVSNEKQTNSNIHHESTNNDGSAESQGDETEDEPMDGLHAGLLHRSNDDGMDESHTDLVKVKLELGPLDDPCNVNPDQASEMRVVQLEVCLKCDQKFTSFKQLVDHNNTVHFVDGDLLLRCGLCDRTFISDCNLVLHLRRYHKKMKALMKCVSCDAELQNENQLRKHIMNAHGGAHKQSYTMRKPRAQIQREYRERKKSAGIEAYKKREVERVRKYYKPVDTLTSRQKSTRRDYVRQAVLTHRLRKKASSQVKAEKADEEFDPCDSTVNMALTNAERQRSYRERKKRNDPTYLKREAKRSAKNRISRDQLSKSQLKKIRKYSREKDAIYRTKRREVKVAEQRNLDDTAGGSCSSTTGTQHLAVLLPAFNKRAKTRAEIQKAYRQRQKEKNNAEYLKKERQRREKNYIPSSQLSRRDRLRRNLKNKESLQRHRIKKRLKQEPAEAESIVSQNSSYQSVGDRLIVDLPFQRRTPNRDSAPRRQVSRALTRGESSQN